MRLYTASNKHQTIIVLAGHAIDALKIAAEWLGLDNGRIKVEVVK